MSGTGSAAANAWGGTTWLGQAGFDTAVTAGATASFSVAANAGFSLSLSGISAYNVRRSSSGPATGQWQYRVAGGEFINIGNPVTWGTVTSGTGNPQAAIDLSSIAALQNIAPSVVVEFRVVNYGASGAAGTWYLNSLATAGPDFVITGTVGSASPNAPSIASFTPTSGATGATVTITGTNFTDASAVAFNAVAAASFSVVNATTISAVVPAGARTGRITVTTPNGTATSSTDFTPLDGSGTVALQNGGAGSFSGRNLFGRTLSGQTVRLVYTPPSSGTVEGLRLAVPAAFGAPLPANVSISGTGSAGASVSVTGQTVAITGLSAASPNAINIQIAGLSTPDTSAPITNTGRYAFTFDSRASGGVFAALVSQPSASVVIPLANARNSDPTTFVPLLLNETVAVEGVCVAGRLGSGATSSMLQDGNLGIALYSLSAVSGPQTRGNRYAAVGTITQFNGLVQLVLSDSALLVDLGAATEPPTPTITVTEFNSSGVAYQSRIIRIENLSFVSGTWAVGQNVILQDPSANQVTIRIQQNSTAVTAPTYPVTITGIGGQFDNASPFDTGFQLQPRDPADLNSATLPSIGVSPSAITSLTATQGSPGVSTNFTASASNLSNNITVTANDAVNFAISTNNIDFTNTLTLPTNATGGLSNTPVYVRLTGAAPFGLKSNTVSLVSGAISTNVIVAGTVTDPNAPSIAVSTNSLAGFATTVGAVSPAQTFVVTASNLTGNVVITPPGGFAVSTDGTTFSTAAIAVPSGQFVSPTTVSVRLTGAAQGSPSGSVTVASTGAATRNVTVSGTVSPAPSPLLALSGTLTNFSATQGAVSAPQSFVVQGSGLASNVTISAPANLQFTTNTNSSYSSPLVLQTTNGALSNTIFSRIPASAAAGGPTTNTITASSGSTIATTNAITTVSSNTNPIISVNPTNLSGFLAQQGSFSTNQTVTVGGTNLQGPITVTAPANYEVSRNGTQWSNSIAIQPAGGSSSNSSANQLVLSNGNFQDLTGLTPQGTPGWYSGVPAGWTGFTGNLIFNVRQSSSSNLVANLQTLSRTNVPFTPLSQAIGSLNSTATVTVEFVLSGLTTNLFNVGAAIYAFPGGTRTLLTNAPHTNSGLHRLQAIDVPANTPLEVAFWSSSGSPGLDDVQVSASSGGPTIVQDATNDIAAGISTAGGTLDIVKMEVTDTATDLVFNLTLNGNTATPNDWGNFMIGIANGKAAGTTNALGNAWNRPINMITPTNGGMTHWIGSWVNGPAGGAQLWSYNGTAWQEQTATPPGFVRTAGTQSLLTYTVPLANLGIAAGDTIFFDAYSSGSNPTDSAVDALSNPNFAIAAWAGPYTSSTNTGLSSYTVGGGGGGGGNVPDTLIFVRLKADAIPADSVGGTLTAASPGATPREVSLSGRVAQVTVSANSLAPFVSLNGAASSTQSFTVGGAGLGTTPISVNAPTGFEISNNGGASYSSSLTLTPTGGAVPSTTITVRMPAGQPVPSTPSGNIALVSAPASQNVAVSGTVIPPGPTILFSPSGGITGLSTTRGTASSAGEVTVNGFNLTGSITATAPSGFEVAVSGGGFGPTATLPADGGSLNVRIVASASQGPVSGNVQLSSGTTTATVPVSGNVAPTPVVTATGTFTPFATVTGFASDPQTFTVSGTNLVQAITVTAPTGFQVAGPGGVYGATATLSPSAGVVSATTVSIRVAASAGVGNLTGSVTFSSQGALSTPSLPVTATVRPVPLLNAAPPTLTGFAAVQGNPSAAQPFTVSGSNLLQDILITAPGNFEISLDGTIWSETILLEPVYDGAPDPNAPPVVVAGDNASNYTNQVPVVFVGSELGNPATSYAVQNWSNPGVAKQYNTGGSEVYGTAGYYQIRPVVPFEAGAAVSVSQAVGNGNDLGISAGTYPTLFAQPTFLSSVTGRAGTLVNFNGYDAYRGPEGSTLYRQGALSVAVNEGPFNSPSGANASYTGVPLQFILNKTAGFRLGLAVDSVADSAYAPKYISLFNTATGTVFSAAQARNGVADMAFFDVYGSAGDTFIVGLWQDAGEQTVAALSLVTFDALPDRPAGWATGSNGGTGFGPWALTGNNGPGVFAGSFLNSSTDGGGNIDTGGVSFGLYANPAAAFSNADRNLATPLQPGESIRVQLALNFNNGNKGLNVYTGGAGGTQLFNFNVGGGASVSAGAGLTLNAGPGAGYDYGGPAVIDVTLTYVSPTQLSYSISRTSPQGNQGVLFSGTITSATPFGAPDGLRFYNSGTDDGAGTNNLYFNNLQILAPGGSGGVVTNTTVQVRLKAGAPVGNVAGAVQVSSGPYVQTRQVNLTGQVFAVPQLTVTPSQLSGLVSAQGEPSRATNFTVGGSNIFGTNIVTVTAPTNFQVSLNFATGFTNTISLTNILSGVLSNTPVYVRISPTAPLGQVSNNIIPATAFGLSQTNSVLGTVESWPVLNPNGLRVTNPAASLTTTATNYTYAGQAGINLTNGIRWSNSLTGATGTLASATDWSANLPLGLGTNSLRFSADYLAAAGSALVALDNPQALAYSNGWKTGANGGFGFGGWELDQNTELAAFFRTTTVDSPSMSVGGLYGFGISALANTRATAARSFTKMLQAPGGAFSVGFDSNDIQTGGEVGLQLVDTNGVPLFTFSAVNPDGSGPSYRIADKMASSAPPGWAYTVTGLRLNFKMTSLQDYELTGTELGGARRTFTYAGKLALPAPIAKMVFFNDAAGEGSRALFFGGDIKQEETVFELRTVLTTAPMIVRRPPTAYESWASGYGLDPSLATGTNAGAKAADPDGDSFSNDQEFAFGTNPTLGSGSLLSMESSGGNLIVRWLQRPGLVYAVQSTTNLAGTPFAHDGSVIVTDGPATPAPPSGYTRKQFSVPANGSKFYHVRATPSP